ncbi:hypothetical protein GOARA_012_00020 [Gordonia araii NBRC 100433]|uniref:Uncharacterized protein n=2 Tax=Gordonia araii TaxID=263909 RepID=G7GXX7_9ACTN|nr:hypothetical protein GOARA_012_00020 [Gordonia araii NBRC 100433]
MVLFLAVATGLVGACGSSESGPTGDVALPADFPAKDVPLLDGRLIQASGSRADGWSLTVQGQLGGPNVLDAAVETLTEAGFTESSRTEEGGTRTVILSAKKGDETYWVTVGSSPRAAGGPNSVFYQVNVDRAG